MSEYSSKRKKDIEVNLDKTYRLLSDIEQHTLIINDPKELMKAQNQIAEFKALIKGFETELRELGEVEYLRSEKDKSQRIIQSLNEAAYAISSNNLTLEGTLEEICDQALKMLGMSIKQGFSHIALVRGDELEWIAASLPDVLERIIAKKAAINYRDPKENPSKKRTIAGLAAFKGRTVSYNKHQDQYKDDYEELSEEKTHQLAVPIRLQKRVIGVLSIGRYEDAFTKDEEEIIERLAVQAALAIRTSIRFDALRKVNEAVKEFEKNVRRQDHLEQEKFILLNKICERTMSVLGKDYDRENVLTHIALLKGKKIEIAGWFPKDVIEKLKPFLEEMERIGEVPPSIIRHVIESEEPRYAPDVRIDKKHFGLHSRVDVKTMSQFSVPFRVTDKIVGVLTVEDPNLNAFNTHDLQSVELLAVQAAYALNYVQSFEEQKTRRWFEKVISNIRNDINCIKELDQITTTAMQEVGLDKKKGFCHIALVKENRLGFVHTNNKEVETSLRLAGYIINLYNITQRSIAGKAAAEESIQNVANLISDLTRVSSDTVKDPDYIIINKDVKAQLSVPVFYKETKKVIGVLSVERTDSSREFSGDITLRKSSEQFQQFVTNVKEGKTKYDELTKLFKEWLTIPIESK